jgi:prophage regulatory protein
MAERQQNVASRILREPELLARVGLGHTRVWELERAGKFPRRFKISPEGRACGWLESAVEQYIAERAQQSRAAPCSGGAQASHV